MKKIIWIVIATVLLFALLIGLTQCSSNDNTDDNTVVKTKYCDLKYPDEWVDRVKVEIDESDIYTVKFMMKDDTPIFDLIFNCDTGYLLGTIEGEKENTVIRIKNYTMAQDDSRYNDFCLIEEGINVITENLSKDYSFAEGKEILKGEGATFEIETRLVPLRYPIKWKNMVTIEVSDTSVKFSCKEHKLFDLLFGSDEGYTLGAYNGETISIVTYDIDKTAVSEELYLQLCTMKDDVNVILLHLMEDESFKTAD